MPKFTPKLWFLATGSRHNEHIQMKFGLQVYCLCCTTPNLALVAKRESVQEPPKNVKICPKLWFLATGSRHNEHIHMKFGL